MGDWIIDTMCESDRPAVREIYREGIATGHATFETEVPDWAAWDAGHRKSCRLVARDGETVGGWAALSPISRRSAYSGVAEVSIYVSAAHRRQGLGGRLLRRLVAESERQGIWTLQAGILAENEASIALHERAGFRLVGRRERIGQLNGHWRDTVLLERRSKVVGI